MNLIAFYLKLLGHKGKAFWGYSSIEIKALFCPNIPIQS